MSKRKIKILLIEASPGDKLLIQKMLAKTLGGKFNLKSAELLHQGLKCLSSEKFDVVLLDLNLPDSRRLSAFTEAHATAPHIPIIILTSLKDESLAIKAIKAGAQDYLVKGAFDGNLLVRSIHCAIERNKSGKALSESEEHYHHLFENAPVGIYRTTPTGRILMANQTFIHLLGYSSFQALARKNLEKDEYFPTYPRKRFKKIMEQEGEIKGLEAWWKRRDGTSVYLRENAKAVRDKKGKIIYYEGTIEDITEYKRALQALQDSEERYRQLVEQSKDAIALVDINGKVIYASQACQQIFGYTPQEFVSDFSLMERNIHPNYRKKYKGFWKLFLTTGKLPQSNQEWAWVHKDGRTVFTQHSFTSIRDEQGKTVGFQTIIRDITEQRLANEQVRILSDMHRLVAEAMVSSKNVSELAQSILNGLDRLIQFDIAEIGVEIMGRPGNCIAQIRLPEGFFQRFTERQIQLGDWMGPGIKVLRFNQPILVTNARTDKLTKYAHDLMTEYDVNQSYTVPLNTKGLTIGVLQISTIGSKTFLKRDLEIVNIVAKEIAAGMEKVMAEEAMEREREAFRIIADSSLQSLDLCQLCQQVLDGLVKVLEFDNGNLALYNEQRKELEYSASIGLKEDIFAELVSPISVDDDRCISAWVARQREPVFAPDVTKHDIYSSHKQRLQELKVKSLLAYPLIGSNDTLLGVLQLCGEKPRILFEADRTFFYAVANMLSSAIEHKLAERSANEQVSILSDIHRLVAEAMATSQNASELAQSILNGLDRLIQFDIAEIGVETMGRPGDTIAQIRLPKGYFQRFTERQIQLGDFMAPGIKALRFNQPVLITNARTDKLTKYAHDLMTEYDVNQQYTVPLNTKGLTTGVLQISTIGSKTFLKRDLEIVNIVAKEIAAGMEKVMAEETVEREREAFRIIADSSLQRLDLCQLCQRVLEGLVKVLEFDNGNLALYSEQKKELEYGASIGEKENIFAESVSPISVDDDRYISSWVARQREPIFAPDVTKHDIYSSHKQRLQELKIKSLLAYPLIGSNDTLLGVLQLCGEKPRILFEADRTFFYAVANMLSSAIEHKLAEIALIESEEKYRTLVEQATDGVMIIQEGILKFVNSALSRMTGYELNELLGLPFIKFIAPDQRELLTSLYRKRMAGEKMPSVYETMGMRKDGTELPVEFNVTLIQYQGKPAELLVLRDLSERKRAEEDLKRAFHQLEQAHNELKQLDEAKSEFLNMTSHELRTPLTALYGYSEILNSGILGPLSDGQKEATQRIFLNAKQLSQLVDDLLDFNRMEAGYLALEQEPCEIAQIIAEVSENMTAAATEKACTISIDCEKNLPMIAADKKRILQVFYNLVDNAIKFSPSGGNIAIGARRQDKFVKLFVKDEGSGIPEQYQKKVFEKFFQIEMGDRRSSGGLGMGLAICKGIVDAHGGDIWVESNPDRGSTFSFTIPIINS